ncbi:hypothetical protein EYC80_006895 [Monilinia laxa]|uniref:Thioredoxin domain-containing protein n=1 Tax=Monilinia laxa TaxID=61186 RepID=A0A5N6JZY0_MONLA|nr:hypothetical protein EYC80_006895 [Monilinia laxa]
MRNGSFLTTIDESYLYMEACSGVGASWEGIYISKVKYPIDIFLFLFTSSTSTSTTSSYSQHSNKHPNKLKRHINQNFGWIPPTPENEDIKACGIPITYNASKEWANKKVVIFSLPGAFTPTCSASHLPGYIAKLPALREKGVDVVATIAYNDPFVMSAWGKANGIHNEDIVSSLHPSISQKPANLPTQLFLSDSDLSFSKLFGWTAGERTGRYALIIDNGKIVYAEIEPGREVTVSGADAVLSKL